MSASRALATTGANIIRDSSTLRLRLALANDSVALPKTAMSVTPCARARSRPRALGTRTG